MAIPEIGRTFLATHDILNEEDRVTYDLLYNGMKKMEKTINLGEKVDNEKIDRIVQRLSCDVPGFFWIGRHYTITQSILETSVSFDIIYDSTQIDDYKNRIKAKINQLQKEGLFNHSNPFDLELAIHDYLISHVDYSDTGNPNEHNILGPLLDNKAVCEGIAATFNFLMNSVGIDCITVFGNSNSELHSWNIIIIDGKAYHVVVTHDLSGMHTFFNVDDETIRSTRKWKIWIKCNDIELNYYVKMGIYFNDIISLKNYLNKKMRIDDKAEFKIIICDDKQIEVLIADINYNGTLRYQASGYGTYMISKEDSNSTLEKIKTSLIKKQSF